MIPSSEKVPRLRKAPQAAGDRLSIRLVLREDGAARLDSEVVPDGRDETVVIAQIRGEAPLEAVTRTVARVSSFERSGRKIESAVMLVAPRSDAEWSASREFVTRALVAHMASSRNGELVISADEADDELYDELSELADQLSAEFSRAGVEVRLRVRGAGSSPVSATVPLPAVSGGAAA